MKKLVLNLVLILLLSLNASAKTEYDKRVETRDSLWALLPTITNAADSAIMLRDIFDLAGGSMRRTSLDLLYNAATNAGNDELRLEAIKQLANVAHTDTAKLKELKLILKTFPQTDDVREIQLFTHLQHIEAVMDADTSRTHAQYVAELIHRYKDDDDIFDRISLLYALCAYMSKSTRGDLLQSYVIKLDSLVNTAPLPIGAVRNLIYTRAAPVFTNAGNAKMAVDIDKKTLNIIDSLQRTYLEQGRIYRDMTYHRYHCYQRMMSNYQALSKTEIEQFHNGIVAMGKSNSNIGQNLNYNPCSEAFYLMSKGEYAKALPLLMKVVDLNENTKFRLLILRAINEASQAVGDKQAEFFAASELTKILSSMIENHEAERLREIQIIYDINDLQNINNTRELTSFRKKEHRNVVVSIIVLVIVILLFSLTIFTLRRNRKQRQEIAKLQAVNEKLLKDSDNLRITQGQLILARDKADSADRAKTDFINNISHEIKLPLNAIIEYTRVITDCIPQDRMPYLQRFANIVELNADMVMNIVNDILDSAELENGNMSINPESSSVQKMCALALDNVFNSSKQDNPDVELIYNPDTTRDILVSTDPRRVVQVLINLLSNARKFTKQGSITLEYFADRDLGILTFAVTDTGIGIPKGKETEIFSRFRKLDNTVPGSGLGLYVSRLIATLLNGTLRVDTDYKGSGSRFLFSIPL